MYTVDMQHNTIGYSEKTHLDWLTVLILDCIHCSYVYMLQHDLLLETLETPVNFEISIV